jgi:transposase
MLPTNTLDAEIVVSWDNLNTHISAAMRQLIAARDWLHVIRLPAYAPDLNPTRKRVVPSKTQPGKTHPIPT